MLKEYKQKLRISRIMFYNEDSAFGIYSCVPVPMNQEIINSYGNVSIQGSTRPLAVGDEVEITFEGAYQHPKYGDFYKIVEVEPERLNTIHEQDNFLKAILADNHFNSLKAAYPKEKLVDLITSGSVDTKLTKGIKDKTLEKIKEKVERLAGVSMLLSMLSDLNLSTNKAQKILQHYGNAEKAMAAIKSNIYNLCELNSFGFATVDKVALDRGDDPNSTKRIYACIDYIMKQEGNDGHTWSLKSDILNQSIETLNVAGELVYGLLDVMADNDKYYMTDTKIAFSKLRNREIEILVHLERLTQNYVANPHADEGIEYAISRVETSQGFSFADEQRTTLINSVNDGVMIINGGGGVGKTTIVKALIETLNAYNYHTACLSGKAANVLMKNGLESSTIHRMLRYSPQDGGFLHNEKSQLPYDVLVLDEFSMNSSELILSVLKATPSGTKLVIVGDSGQLASIGNGSADVLRDILATKRYPVYELTQFHRQAAKSGILQLANKIRRGEQIMPYGSSGKQAFGEDEDQTVIGYQNKENIPNDIIRIAKKYKSKITCPEDLFEFQIIVSNRERGELSVRILNLRLQEIFNDLDKPSLSRNGYHYREGDKIIAQGNSYKQSVFEDYREYREYLLEGGDDEGTDQRTVDVYNGTLGYISEVVISTKVLLIQFEGIDGLVAVSQQGADKIDLAYATTCHKAQGSGIKDVIAALDFSSYKLLSRQLLYTMVSRASRKGVLLVETNAMVAAIKNDASSNRRTFLADVIRQLNKMELEEKLKEEESRLKE